MFQIDSLLNGFNKSNRKGENINKNFCIMNELKTLKKKTILNNEKYFQ